MFSIPNCLTYFRIIAIPLIAGLYLSDITFAHWYATAIFILAAVTDWLDGYLARKWQQMSKLGAFLDPVADKLLVVVLLVVIASNDLLQTALLSHGLFLFAVLVIISREIIISALREWMAEIGKRDNVAVSYVGKVKTSVQMTAIGFFLFEFSLFGLPVLQIGELLLYVAAILTVWSMIIYFRGAYRAISN